MAQALLLAAVAALSLLFELSLLSVLSLYVLPSVVVVVVEAELLSLAIAEPPSALFPVLLADVVPSSTAQALPPSPSNRPSATICSCLRVPIVLTPFLEDFTFLLFG